MKWKNRVQALAKMTLLKTIGMKQEAFLHGWFLPFSTLCIKVKNLLCATPPQDHPEKLPEPKLNPALSPRADF